MYASQYALSLILCIQYTIIHNLLSRYNLSSYLRKIFSRALFARIRRGIRE